MSDDDAVCFRRLRIEDDSNDNDNSNSWIEDHEKFEWWEGGNASNVQEDTKGTS
jgi:hypothetical protein